MAKKQEKEIERWVTVNGARVPIFKDGSIGGPKALRDKVKATQDKKTSAKNYENKSFNGMVLDMKKDGFSIADTGNNTGHGGLKDGATLSVYDKNTKQYHKAIYHKDKNGKSSIDIQKKETEKPSTKNFESMNSIELSSIDLKKLSDDEFSKLHKVVKNKYPDKLGLRSRIIEESNRRFFEQSKKEPSTKKKSSTFKPGDTIEIEQFSSITGKSKGYKSFTLGSDNRWSAKDGESFDNNEHELSKHSRSSKSGIQGNIKKSGDTKENQIARNKKEADERNNQVSDRVKSYQDKFLKKRSVEEIKEIQSNIEKSGSHLGYTDSDMVAMRAIENELKERSGKDKKKTSNSKDIQKRTQERNKILGNFAGRRITMIPDEDLSTIIRRLKNAGMDASSYEKELAKRKKK